MKIRHHSHQGAALIIVLACLIFVSVIVVAFLASMRSKLVVSKASANTTEVRMLSETAVNIAIAQVNDATKVAGTSGSAWASQPGMIRLYGSNGQPSGYYKLYSSDNMIGTGAFNPSSDPVPTNWEALTALFTDLNAPVNGVFPIFDFEQAKKQGVLSLEVISAPGATTPVPAPMPVKWLYVLADGSIHAPDVTSTATKAVISQASTTNPIVGRIAFWADDESCKVNLNTASVALSPQTVSTTAPYAANSYTTFWDTPRFNTPMEQNFARFQPAQGEYQRYPGHPATVGLNAVFPSSTTQEIEDIFTIAPRAAYDGSKGATVDVNAAKWINRANLADRLYASVDDVIFQDKLRSGTNLLTNSEVQASRFFVTTSSRAPELNLFGRPRVSIWPVDTSIINATSSRVTTLDRLLAFCATVGPAGSKNPFYFTRRSAVSTTEDVKGERNQTLLTYLDELTGKSIPGYGGSFQGKYTQPETREILTLIFDYIRLINTEDPLLPGVVVNSSGQTNSPNWFAATPTTGWELGKGQVAPTVNTTWNTQGIGSFWRPVEISIHFVGLGDGPLTPSSNPPRPAKPGIPIPPQQVAAVQSLGPSLLDPTITSRPIDPAKPADGDGHMPPDDERAVQAFLLVSFLNPAHCRINGSSRMWMKVTGLDSLKVSGPTGTWKSLNFPGSASMLVGANLAGDAIGSGPFFGYMPMTGILSAGGYTRQMGANSFPFYSGIVALPAGNNESMKFSGGTITIELYDISAGPTLTNNSTTLPTGANKVQTINIDFPEAVSGTLPLPGITGLPLIGTNLPKSVSGEPAPSVEFDKWSRIKNYDRWRLPTKQTDELKTENGDKFDGRQGRNVIDGLGVPDMAGRSTPDVVQSMVLSEQYGDARLLAKNEVPAAAFAPHPRYGNYSLAFNHFIGSGSVFAFNPGNSGTFGKLVQNADYAKMSAYNPLNFTGGYPNPFPYVSPLTTSVPTWDWDNGIGNYGDGPWINKADEGGVSDGSSIPYYHRAGHVTVPGTTFFSPNRQVSSPGTLGSLPTGASRGISWQTLLFRPGPTGHPGSVSPPDHLWMDLFWMPVVEPYAISEPFSTGGKINLNQQMVPFTYIKRYTGLRAAMMGERVAVMPRSQAPTYKQFGSGGTAVSTYNSRLPIDFDRANGTFKQLDDKFDSGDIFRSATEICDLYLVPLKDPSTPGGYPLATFKNDWYDVGGDFALVGDNTRERPYANIYGKLTTKSNTFTVHYRAQVLRKSELRNRTNPTEFDLSAGDSIMADQRGSNTFERYIDPADTRLSADPATHTDSLEALYRTRVVSTTLFNP